MRAIGVMTTLIVILAVGILAVGLWRDWFDISATSSDSESSSQLDVSVRVNREKFEEDTARLREGAESAVETRTVRGVVRGVDESGGVLTVEDEDGEEVSFVVGEASEVRVNDEAAALGDLREGDEVTVVYRERDEGNVAREVEVSRE